MHLDHERYLSDRVSSTSLSYSTVLNDGFVFVVKVEPGCGMNTVGCLLVFS